MFETVNNLITSKKIPALEPIQMLALLQYVFTLNHGPLPTPIAKTLYRYDSDHSMAFDVFLNSRLPAAHLPSVAAQEVN